MAELEALLDRLLIPDNAVIQQATRDLQSIYKDPSIVPALCTLLTSSQSPQVRQFAAVLLRKRLIKLWKKLDASTRERLSSAFPFPYFDNIFSIKAVLIQSLVQEKIHVVLNSTAYLVGVIAKHEVATGQWNEVFEFILQHCRSEEPFQREVAMLVMDAVMQSAALELQAQTVSILALLTDALADPTSYLVQFYAIRCLIAMVEHMKEEEARHFTDLTPRVIIVIKTLLTHDEDKACEAMELFDELVECEVDVIVPHFIPLVHLCLELASNINLGNSIRIKALSLISWFATIKKKALLKHGLLQVILQTVLKIMATPTEDEEDTSTESQSPISVAAQVLDVLSLNLSPEKILIPVLQMVHPWLDSKDEFQRTAAIISIAVMVEGCSEHIRNKCLPDLLQIIYKAVTDPCYIVRNAALFAIGQFSEYLQPEISQYSEDLLPVLFQYVDHALMSNHADNTALTKIFYALETFCEQLGTGLVPYLPRLMDKLFLALAPSMTLHTRELGISAIGAVANACQENLLPYFPQIIAMLKEYLVLPYEKHLSILQSQAVDTLGVLARTIGAENFVPIAHESISLGMTLLQVDDPDLRRSVYGLFASLSCVLGEKMAAYLDQLVPKMIHSLSSEDGVSAVYSSTYIPFLDFSDEEEEEAQDGDCSLLEDNDGLEGYSVENAFLEEKEDACNALGEIAENCSVAFVPYMDECFKEVNALSEHSFCGIRKAAISTLGVFCRLWYQQCINQFPAEKSNLDVLINTTLLSMAAIVRTDTDRAVVTTTLETLESLLKFLKGLPFVLEQNALQSMTVSLQDVLEIKAQCQGTANEAEYEGEQDMAEYDNVVVESAGCVIGPLASVAGGHTFLPFLTSILPHLLKKLAPSSTVADRSFAVGTMAEIVDGMGTASRFLLDFYPIFMQLLYDMDDEVCSNAIYGLGQLATKALPEMERHYADILKALFRVSQMKTNARLLDNICGALCRMISAQQDAVPLNDVIPILMQHLPLKEDMEENETVYTCLMQLLANHHPALMACLAPLLQVLAVELSTSALVPALKNQLIKTLKDLYSQCPEQLNTASSHLSEEMLLVLHNALKHCL